MHKISRISNCSCRVIHFRKNIALLIQFLIPLLVFCIGYGKYEWCDHFGWSPYCHGSHQYYCYKHYLWRVTWDVLGSGGGSFHDILRHHIGKLPCDHCRLSIHFSSNSGQFICGWIGEPWFYFRDIGCVHDTANGFSKHHGSLRVFIKGRVCLCQCDIFGHVASWYVT